MTARRWPSRPRTSPRSSAASAPSGGPGPSARRGGAEGPGAPPPPAARLGGAGGAAAGVACGALVALAALNPPPGRRRAAVPVAPPVFQLVDALEALAAERA